MEGGYDEGYRICKCFWGTDPGRLVKHIEQYIDYFSGLMVLDVGCGEGKNAIYLSRLGAKVHAIDISERGIFNAKAAWPDFEKVSWEVRDIRNTPLPDQQFDLIIAYGLLHCLSSIEEVRNTITKLQTATKPQGFNIICAFNDRSQSLEAHPGFLPTLLGHEFYTQSYNTWNLLYCSDEDLLETHPHNNIPHLHSLSRLIAKKDDVK